VDGRRSSRHAIQRASGATATASGATATAGAAIVAAEARRYRFGPLERRGLVGGLRTGQVLVVGATLVAIIVLLQVSSSAAMVLVVFVAALAAAGFCFAPIAGRTAEEWTPVLLVWVLRGGRRRRRFRSGASTGGHRGDPIAGPTYARPQAEGDPPVEIPEPATLPAELTGIELLAAPLRGEDIGIVKDARGKTYTGVIAVRVRSFGLLDQSEQERRLAGWGSVLAGLARESTPVRRIQWLERTLPSDGDQIARYLQEERDVTVPLSASPVASYIELVESAGAVTRDHDLFVCLQVDAKKGWRQVKRLGRGDEGACALLARELETLAERLVAADVQVFGVLRPWLLAQVIRDAYDPYGRAYRDRLATLDPGGAGVDPRHAGPVAADVSWSQYRTDSAFHATYWVAQWPRIDVGATFLAPLLMQTNVLRAITTVMEPIAPSVAIRKVEAARTTDIADEQTRARTGFITTARKRLQQDATLRREEELADGHAEFRFAAYVTVSAPDPDELERSCAEVEHAAQQSRLELVRLYGQQAEGFTFTLPLARGLR
jgi:hypothetical protein